MCKEKVAELKLRKRQPTSDGEEATSEFSKCITAVRIEVLFFFNPVLGVWGGHFSFRTNTLGCSITHKAGIYLVELGLFHVPRL